MSYSKTLAFWLFGECEHIRNIEENWKSLRGNIMPFDNLELSFVWVLEIAVTRGGFLREEWFCRGLGICLERLGCLALRWGWWCLELSSSSLINPETFLASQLLRMKGAPSYQQELRIIGIVKWCEVHGCWTHCHTYFKLVFDRGQTHWWLSALQRKNSLTFTCLRTLTRRRHPSRRNYSDQVHLQESKWTTEGF